MRILIITGILLASVTSMFAQAKIDADLELMVEMAQLELSTSQPTALEPLALNAKIVPSENKQQFAVIMKATLLQNWQIYAHAADNTAYITTSLKLTMPEGVKAISEWIKPEAEYYTKDISVYKGEVSFVRYFERNEQQSANTTIKCGLHYQACDKSMCFPPKTKMIDLKL